MAHGIKTTLTEQYIARSISNQNDCSRETTRSPSSKLGKKGLDWVIEVDGKPWKQLINNGEVYLGCDAFAVKDCVSLTRCYKCQRYGHLAKNCIAGDGARRSGENKINKRQH
jgi:hypothetical protein